MIGMPEDAFMRQNKILDPKEKIIKNEKIPFEISFSFVNYQIMVD